MKPAAQAHDLRFEDRQSFSRAVGVNGTGYLVRYKCDRCCRRVKFITLDETSLPAPHEVENAQRRLAAFTCEVSI